MAETQQELNKQQKELKKRSTRKITGRKTGRTARKKVADGHGGDRLHTAVDDLVATRSGEIAKALVDKTVAGNMTLARLLFDLTDAKKPPKPASKRRRLSMAEKWAAEPAWQYPPDSDEDGGLSGCEPEA